MTALNKTFFKIYNKYGVGAQIVTHTNQCTQKLSDDKKIPKKDDDDSQITLFIEKIYFHPIQTVLKKTKTTSKNGGWRNN